MKLTFEQSCIVESCIRAHCEKEDVDRLDLTKLAALSPEHTLTAGITCSSDVAWEAPLKDGQGKFIFLFEFQSRVDRWMSNRTMLSSTLALVREERLSRADPAGLRPVAVVPIVIYHGPGKWTAGLTRREAGLLPPMSEEVKSLQHEGRYKIVELLIYDGPALYAQDEFYSSFMRLLRHDNREDAHRELRSVLRLARKQGNTDLGSYLFGMFIEVAKACGEVLWDDKEEWTMEEAMERIEERFPDFMAGLRAESREEGHLEGRKELLVKLCRERFGQRCASSFAKLLKPVDELACLDEIGVSLLKCDSGDELLAHVSSA